MAAVAFDPLEYTHMLEASGVPREQAEVHAKAMTAMFIHNFDALVTNDYLDTRFELFGAAVNANIDKRLSKFRLEMNGEIGALRRDVWELRSTLKLQSWILTVLMAGIFVPMVQAYFT